MMSRNTSENVTQLSQALRKRMTREEKRLWYEFLSKLPVTVCRQKTLDDYIVDFYIAKLKLVIEVDGAQHYTEQGRRADSERDGHLAKTGNLVLRYTNHDVNTNLEGVCRDIARVMRERGMDKDWDPFPGK
jgi:very-short-patch-repair endonuclease